MKETSPSTYSDVGCCGLGGGLEGLGPIRPSARGNTIPGEERGAEVNKSIKAFILLAILFCYRLSYTQPFRNSVVEGDGVYTGEDPILVKNGKTLEHFSSQETIRGDLSGGGWGARAASGNFQTSFFTFDPMRNRIPISKLNPTAGLILVMATYKKSASCPHLDW